MRARINLSRVLVPKKQKGLIRRARLVDQLYDNLHKKLTFISASAGYGKSSLLVDFARDVDARICWYHITRLDSDLRLFASYLLASFRQQFPAFGRQVEEVLHSTQGRLDSISLAADFVNAAIEGVDDYSLLFLDDYHTVGENTEVTAFFEAVLDNLPEQVRVLAASRTAFGIPTAKLYVRDEIHLLNVEDLRFRAAELQELVRKAYRFKLSDDEAEAFARRSDGWIVAILLALRSADGGRLPEFEGASEHVYSFLADDVFGRESAPLQDFMLSVSLVDTFDAPIGAHLSDAKDVRTLIHELEQRNLFITRIEEGDGNRYRFHQLFAEFLNKRLQDHFPDRKAALHIKAGQWFESAGDLEPAIEHYLLAGDRQAAAPLIDQFAKQVYVFGQDQRLDNWLRILSLEPDLRHKAPQLVLNRAKSLIDKGAFDEGSAHLDIAEAIFRQEHAHDQLLNTLSARGILYLRTQRYEDMFALIREAEDILAALDGEEVYPPRRQQFERLEGLGLMHQGKAEAGLEKLKSVIRVLEGYLERYQDSPIRTQIAHDLVACLTAVGYEYYRQGRLFESLRYIKDLLEVRKKYFHNNQGMILALNNLGFLYHQVGRLQDAYHALAEAIQLSEKTERSQAVVHLYNSWADFLRDQSEWDLAQDYLNRVLRWVESDPRLRGRLDISGTYLSLMALERVRGNYDEAIIHLHEAARLRNEDKDSPDFLAKQGAIFLSMGQLDLAAKNLVRADTLYEGYGLPSQLGSWAAFLRGQVEYLNGDHEAALASLERSLSLAAQIGYDHFLVSEGTRAKRFLKVARKKRPDFGQLSSLWKRVEEYRAGIKQFARPEPEEALPADFRLEVRAFGEGAVRRNGEPLSRSEWRAAMAKALVFYLLDSKGARREDIKLAFWPEMSPSRATSNLQSTLWRARNALGNSAAIAHQEDRYEISAEINLWYDVEEFERLLAQARQPGLSKNRQIDLLNQAADLYRGDFLDDVYMDWATERRYVLARKYMDALEKLGNLAYELGDYDRAITAYIRLVEKDNFRDDIHLAIMRAYDKKGATNAAVNHFRSHVDYLKNEGLVPASELEAYFLSISKAS